jgi:predicted dehydrogenase
VLPGDHPRVYAGLAAALKGAPLYVTPEQSLAVMAVVEAAAEAACSGVAQPVPPFRL